ncbi:hypothetical protein ABZ128_27695 [Streptomyces sp. NPDC006326]|uniref:hypothetical protein n=1 Tax=Streptomyces sp. NPDC006326 TaxID=3156752 RepID=UPI0033A25EA0
MTMDPAKAREWLEDWTDVSGVEGIVVKGPNQRYLPGMRGWYEIRRRDTTEAVIGAITGTVARPQLKRLRLNVTVEGVPRFGQGPTSAVG